jgi:hypothetical protein
MENGLRVIFSIISLTPPPAYMCADNARTDEEFWLRTPGFHLGPTIATMAEK